MRAFIVLGLLLPTLSVAQDQKDISPISTSIPPRGGGPTTGGGRFPVLAFCEKDP